MKKQQMTNFFIIFFIGVTLSSCSHSEFYHDFLCSTPDNKIKMEFSHSDLNVRLPGQCARLRCVSSYADSHKYPKSPFKENDRQEGPITVNMKSRPYDYYLKIEEDKIFLQVMQGTAREKLEPTGEKPPRGSETVKKYKHLLTMKRYHVAFSGLKEYVFDKKSSQLTLFNSPLLLATSAIEQRYYPGETYPYPKKIRDLSSQEVANLFPNKKSQTLLYCQHQGYSFGPLKEITMLVKALFYYFKWIIGL